MASREKSGYTIHLDTPEDVRQLRLLLQGLPEERPLLPTFRELAARWYGSVAGRLVDPSNERRHLARLNEALGHLTEETLLPGDIQAAIAGMTELGPSTKNKVRSTGARVVTAARMNGEWRAGNPFEPVARYKVPKRAYEVLALAEVRRVLACVRADRRDLFTVAMVMGDRKGELFALRKEDVDLDARVMWIRRSHGREQTKTGRPRQVPIPLAALEPLRRAVQSSPSELVFPREDGSRFRHDTKLTRVLRTAMAEAGLVTGFDAKCRRRGCGHAERLLFRESKVCPRCGFQLWLVPRVRPVRFQDLRHTAATLHWEAGCNPTVVRLLLGHAAVGVTEDVYLHLSLDFQRRELDKLTL